MNEMLSIATLNSRIKFDKTDIPFAQREIMGDATETGLSRFAGRYVEDYDTYIKMFPKMFEVPFNSTNKWALTLVSPSRHSVLSENGRNRRMLMHTCGCR